MGHYTCTDLPQRHLWAGWWWSRRRAEFLGVSGVVAPPVEDDVLRIVRNVRWSLADDVSVLMIIPPEGDGFVILAIGESSWVGSRALKINTEMLTIGEPIWRTQWRTIECGEQIYLWVNALENLGVLQISVFLSEFYLSVFGLSEIYLSVYGLRNFYLSVFGLSEFYLSVFGLSETFTFQSLVWETFTFRSLVWVSVLISVLVYHRSLVLL